MIKDMQLLNENDHMFFIHFYLLFFRNYKEEISENKFLFLNEKLLIY